MRPQTVEPPFNPQTANSAPMPPSMPKPPVEVLHSEKSFTHFCPWNSAETGESPFDMDLLPNRYYRRVDHTDPDK
jgi:hypothetical protein